MSWHVRRGSLKMLIFRFHLQDLFGSVLPAIEGDELDVTIPETPKEPEHVVLESTPQGASEGLNVLQKAVFLGIILGLVAMFLKTRKGPVSGEKMLP